MLKKILYGFAAALTLTACTGDYTDWAEPQQNAQPATVTFGNGSVAPVDLVDFATLEKGQELVKVCNLTAPTASKEGYTTPIYKLNIDEQSFELTTAGEMNAEELKAYIEANFGKAPKEREITATVEQWISNGTSAVKTATSAEFTIKAKLTAPYISEKYWIVGAPSQWDVMCTDLPFQHNDANDVYDDPIFTATFTIEGECWFAIADEKTHESGAWSDLLGCAEGNGENGMTGEIKRRTELSDDGSWKVYADVESKVIVTLNMMEYTYSIRIVPVTPFYYVVGGIQGWSDSKRTHLFSPEAEAKVFSYTTKWTGAWDLKIWGADDFGNWDNAMGCAVDGCADATGDIIFANAQAISAPSAEYYTFTINMKDNTYEWVKLDDQNPAEYEAISLIGGFNDWGGDVDLEQVCAHNWYVEYELAEATELKFRANHDWGTNWGADFDIAVNNFAQGVGNGPNLNVPAGTYRFYFNDITGKLAIVPVE